MTKNFTRLVVHAGVFSILFLAVSCVCAKPAVLSQLLDQGVVRFYGEGIKPEQLSPSLALEAEPKVQGSAPKGWTLTPDFTVDKDGRYAARIDIQSGTSLYGTGEVIGPLLRNGTVVECWNTDAYGYGPTARSLYQSHPWVLAVRPDGTSFGVLADTTYRCRIDLTNNIEFAAEGPGYPVIVIDADSPQNVIRKLAKLIGTMPLPPKWAIGYHQCRYSYYPASRVLEVARGFRDRNIPCDVIWMDIDYMNGYRIFTFDPNGFPDPKGVNADLHKLGFKSIWMIDPGVKAQKGYFVYDQGVAGDHFVKKADGSEYNGEVWPGMCAFPDFTNPRTQTWWAGLYKDFMGLGVDGVWNDMCEPAVFNVPSKTMPTDNLHVGGDGLPRGTHAQYHNVYGMLMVKSSRQGILAANPDKRPFVLVRANYIGGQRYAATWTGDNTANWEHLEYSVPMVLNLGLSGQPFSGPDIGGFVGAGDGNLFARWMSVGALLPFSRGHAEKGAPNKEPWAFGKEVEEICRTALQRRYRLLPYLYTLFQDSSQTGLPVMRPVFFADPDDPKLRAEDDAFLLGSDLLVIPKLTIEGNRICAQPQGIWRPVSLAKEETSQPQLKIRGGAIIPLGKVVQNTTENSLDELTLLVCLDDKGMASGTLYEDAGDGYGYLKDEFCLSTFSAQKKGSEVTVKCTSQKGKQAYDKRSVTVAVVDQDGVRHGFGDMISGVKVKLDTQVEQNAEGESLK